MQVKLAPRQIVLMAGMLIALLYFAFPNPRLDFTPFNGHDAESYLALSDSLANGRGYTRSYDPEMYLAHTTWPPLLPVLMMPASLAEPGPGRFMAAHLLVILIGLSGGLCVWAWARRISGSDSIAGAAALVLMLNPFYWHLSRVVLTEAPSVAIIFASLLLADRIWACRRVGVGEALACGLVIGLAMLMRGSLLGLGLIPLAYFLGPRASDHKPLRHILMTGIYGVGFTVPFLGWGLRNLILSPAPIGFDGVNQLRMLFVEHPLDPDSTLRTLPAMLQDTWEVIFWHVIYELPQQLLPGVWAVMPEDWPGGPLIPLALLLMAVIVLGPWRWPLQLIWLVVAPAMLLNLTMAAGEAARYWVPIYLPLLVAGVVAWGPLVGRWMADVAKGVRWGAAGAALLALMISLGGYIAATERAPYHTHEKWSYPDMAALFEAMRQDPPEARGVAGPNLFSIPLYTGLPAPLSRPEAGYDPLYDHIILPSADVAAVCTACTVLQSSGDWTLVKLPVPATYNQIWRDYWRGRDMSGIRHGQALPDLPSVP